MITHIVFYIEKNKLLLDFISNIKYHFNCTVIYEKIQLPHIKKDIKEMSHNI